MTANRQAEGFTLIEVIVAVAIVAVMAGAITPVVFHQMNSARSEATSKELGRLKNALLEFYEDTGRFPTEGEGVDALITDPGVNNWNGPYIADSHRNVIEEIREDAFGSDYVYDLNPNVGAATVDLLLASGGINRVTDAGRLNRPWNLDAAEDDLFALMSSSALNRTKQSDAEREIEEVADACREHFEDLAAFPANFAALDGDYLDGGIQGEAFRDEWNNAYVMQQSGGMGTAVMLLVYSLGPDQADDGGGDDDIAVSVSSIPPGRRTTEFELEVAQAALNAQPGLGLGGGWTGAGGIRQALGLAGVFDLDGWGNSYRVNVGSRVIFSAGPDGVVGTTNDNIPVGVGL